MKAHYRTRNQRILFEVEASSQKGLFREIAQIQHVFEADDVCSLCGSPLIQYQVRTIDSNEFFSIVCLACRAELTLGQHKQGGTLFPKRDSPDRGWKVYQRDSPDH